MSRLPKTPDVADKIFKIVCAKCEEFEEKDWNEWDKYLSSVGVESHGYESHSDCADMLFDIINSEKDVIAFDDPWADVKDEYGMNGFLVVSRESAEKILVLGRLP